MKEKYIKGGSNNLPINADLKQIYSSTPEIRNYTTNYSENPLGGYQGSSFIGGKKHEGKKPLEKKHEGKKPLEKKYEAKKHEAKKHEAKKYEAKKPLEKKVRKK
jgi:hypothetical protein